MTLAKKNVSKEEAIERANEARRRNLEPYMNEPLSDKGHAVPITSKFPPEVVAAIDKRRGTKPRSAFIRDAVASVLASQEE